MTFSTRTDEPQEQRRTARESTITAVLGRYRDAISTALHRQVTEAHAAQEDLGRAGELVREFYGQIEYHFGWSDGDLRPSRSHPGKLLRPALVLYAAELGQRTAADRMPGDVVARAMPAAVAVEMIHNFSLIHDDIEDQDELRRHRPTLWRVWGQAQAINTGDGLFALARLSLFGLLETGVPATLVARLAILLDHTCLRLCEGQHLDMRFEGQADVTSNMYMSMIERKTAALMECATQMGALLGGASDEVAELMAQFGRSLGLGFQLRDDLLGIWASDQQLGKTAAGDVRRKKMSLPVIYALEQAKAKDRERLLEIYRASGQSSEEEVADALAILGRAQAQAYVRETLLEQCAQARGTLAQVAGEGPAAVEAAAPLLALVDYVAADALGT